MLHDRVQPLNEGLHCGVLPEQLLQLPKNSDGVIWKKESSSSIMIRDSEYINNRDSSYLTLRVDVWVLVSSSAHTKQRLWADAAELHVIDIQHHAGHYSLVKQCWTSYLQSC